MFSEIDIIECLDDNIFVMLNGHLFPQTVGRYMGTKCDPLADLLLYLYKKDFIAQSFNFTFCYRCCPFINNSKFADFVSIPLIIN